MSRKPPSPWASALKRFDPSAEPYANMTPAKLEEVKAAMLRAHDVAGYWEAELHQAEKTPALERFLRDLNLSVAGELFRLDRSGELPYEGWAIRHLMAATYVTRKGFLDEHEPGDALPETPRESREWAEVLGVAVVRALLIEPGEVEELQNRLERDNGGPFEVPEGFA